MIVEEIRIVFDGPPGHESGRLVEVEDKNGRSINAGEWRKHNDGLWELEIVLPRHAHVNNGDGSDICRVCNHDLRHATHHRVERDEAIAQAESEEG